MDDLWLSDLSARLSRDEISWHEALDQFTKRWQRIKPWQTRRWKERRDAVIGKNCIQCGSKGQEMVLQHLWHPPSFAQIFREISGEWTNFKKDQINALAKQFEIDADVCVHCGSANIRFRKTLNSWCCDACKSEFAEPVRGKKLDRTGLSQLSFAKRRTYRKRWEDFLDHYGPAHGKQAMLTLINQHQRYFAFEGATTFCKKCAYLWDKKGVRLCQLCGERFHWIPFRACRECSVRES